MTPIVCEAAPTCKPDAAGERFSAEAEFLTEKQLLDRIPVSRRTLFDWRHDGKIPFVKLSGRRVLFHWGSVREALLRAQKGVNP